MTKLLWIKSNLKKECKKGDEIPISPVSSPLKDSPLYETKKQQQTKNLLEISTSKEYKGNMYMYQPPNPIKCSGKRRIHITSKKLLTEEKPLSHTYETKIKIK